MEPTVHIWYLICVYLCHMLVTCYTSVLGARCTQWAILIDSKLFPEPIRNFMRRSISHALTRSLVRTTLSVVRCSMHDCEIEIRPVEPFGGRFETINCRAKYSTQTLTNSRSICKMYWNRPISFIDKSLWCPLLLKLLPTLLVLSSEWSITSKSSLWNALSFVLDKWRCVLVVVVVVGVDGGGVVVFCCFNFLFNPCTLYCLFTIFPFVFPTPFFGHINHNLVGPNLFVCTVFVPFPYLKAFVSPK